MVSIHAARVGSDDARLEREYSDELFQSTLPVWAATSDLMTEPTNDEVSIHAARVGSDVLEAN